MINNYFSKLNIKTIQIILLIIGCILILFSLYCVNAYLLSSTNTNITTINNKPIENFNDNATTSTTSDISNTATTIPTTTGYTTPTTTGYTTPTTTGGVVPSAPTVSTTASPDAASAILDIQVNTTARLSRKDYPKLDSVMSIIENGLSNGKTYSSEVMAKYNTFKAYFKKLDADRLDSDINNQEMLLENDKSQLDSAKKRLDSDPTEEVYQTVYNNRLKQYNRTLSYLNELKAKKSSMG